MWAVISEGKIIQTINNPRPLTLSGIQYPRSIFSSAWTDAERKAIGILPYIYSGQYQDDMFYTGSEGSPVIGEDSVNITQTKNERTVSFIKDNMKAQVNSVLSSELGKTDWIIIRKADIDKEPPADLMQCRTDLRAKAAELEAAIDEKDSVDNLKAMTVLTQEMLDAGNKAAVFYDWPKNPRSG